MKAVCWMAKNKCRYTMCLTPGSLIRAMPSSASPQLRSAVPAFTSETASPHPETGRHIGR